MILKRGLGWDKSLSSLCIRGGFSGQPLAKNSPPREEYDPAEYSCEEGVGEVVRTFEHLVNAHGSAESEADGNTDSPAAPGGGETR